MASDLATTVIAAGAVLGGAVLGGGAQIIVSWRLRVHERRERARAQRRQAYRDLLGKLAGWPTFIEEGVNLAQEELEARITNLTRELNILEAEFSLYAAPKQIVDLVDPVIESFWNMMKEPFPAIDKIAMLKLEVQDRYSRHAEPAVKKLAEAMAADIDSRP